MGPGFLVSIAYVDPGNFESDIQAGYQFEYQLIWVLLWTTAMGLFLQVLAVRFSLVTERHLARACRDEYQRNPWLVRLLWILTEIAIIASDIPEVSMIHLMVVIVTALIIANRVMCFTCCEDYGIGVCVAITAWMAVVGWRYRDGYRYHVNLLVTKLRNAKV